MRQIVAGALTLVALGAGGSTLMTASWQLHVFWGVLIGTGTGSMALVLAATVANRWFVARRGLVMGVLTAGSATGQLIFLPPVAALAEDVGWRPGSLVIAVAALAVAPIAWLVMRDHPHDRGVLPFGADPRTWVPPAEVTGGAMGRAIDGLRFAARHKAFWALALAFAICGATTNGLIGIHFIPSAHDHGMSQTTAAWLLALVGIFDIVGTIASGWLTDVFDPRWLLVAYYFFRGVRLLALPLLLWSLRHPLRPSWTFAATSEAESSAGRDVDRLRSVIVQEIDPRDSEWEVERPIYRVYFWRQPPTPKGVPQELVGFQSDEYQLSEVRDVGEVLDWARTTATVDQTFTLYVEHPCGDSVGLIQLAGRDPTALT